LFAGAAEGALPPLLVPAPSQVAGSFAGARLLRAGALGGGSRTPQQLKGQRHRRRARAGVSCDGEGKGKGPVPQGRVGRSGSSEVAPVA